MVSETLGCQITWEDGVIKITKGRKSIVLTIGSNQASIDGNDVTVYPAPMLVNGRTVVPIRFISETLEYRVIWNDAAQEIIISR